MWLVYDSNDPKRANLRLPTETPVRVNTILEPRESWNWDTPQARIDNTLDYRHDWIASGEHGEWWDDGGKKMKRSPRRDSVTHATNEYVSATKLLAHSNSRIPASRQLGRSNAGVSFPR